MAQASTFLVLGATGGTGRHFIERALADGHKVRALARTPAKLVSKSNTACLEIRQGSITDPTMDTDELVKDVDYIVSMLGDRVAQESEQINLKFMQRLIPSMRRYDVKRILYQAGAFSRPHLGSLSPLLWILKHTIARSYRGQHEDNEAVMAYFSEEAMDIEWSVHRAGISGDGSSKGSLERSEDNFSVATFRDCADYNYRTVMDADAVHSQSFSCYKK